MFVSNIFQWDFGVGLRREWVRSNAACVYEYSEDILGKGRIYGKNYVVLETISAGVLGIYEVIKWQFIISGLM